MSVPLSRTRWTLAAGSAATLALAFVSPQGDVSFKRQIAPMIYKKCASCHQPGGPSPFSLLTYQDIKRRFELIRQVALNRTMPPTDASSDFAKVAENEPLTDYEAILLQEWARSGLEEGDPKAALPPMPRPPSEWRLGAPDLVVRPKQAITISADGPPARRRVWIDLPEGQARSLVAFDLRPRVPGVMRFARLALPARGEDPFPLTGAKMEGFIGTWAMGHFPWRLPDRSSIQVPSRARLALEALYAPTGKREDGSFELALYFAPAAGEKPRTKTLGNRDFILPAGEFATLTDSWSLDEDVSIVGIFPEVRFFGRQFYITAQEPGLPKKTLLLVLTYEPYWIGSYVFERPVRLRKGTRIEVKVQYDNTQHAFGERVRNTYPVTFGPLDTQDTFWVHFQYTSTKEP